MVSMPCSNIAAAYPTTNSRARPIVHSRSLFANALVPRNLSAIVGQPTSHGNLEDLEEFVIVSYNIKVQLRRFGRIRKGPNPKVRSKKLKAFENHGMIAYMEEALKRKIEGFGLQEKVLRHLFQHRRYVPSSATNATSLERLEQQLSCLAKDLMSRILMIAMTAIDLELEIAIMTYLVKEFQEMKLEMKILCEYNSISILELLTSTCGAKPNYGMKAEEEGRERSLALALKTHH
ncbi:hypothetical protein M9H77_17738 [Catharanthus roseus]|uniref:Uncharacterized protein n=1 Tax=Catharanthus roseus TaxID=4058 RepID=A0ACC0B5F0_CATRO|nr:hypothetical protein M9H77_17738 [Catharanthus roseus]